MYKKGEGVGFVVSSNKISGKGALHAINMTIARTSSRLFGKRCAKFFGARFADAPRPTGAGSTWSPRNRCNHCFSEVAHFCVCAPRGRYKNGAKVGLFPSGAIANRRK